MVEQHLASRGITDARLLDAFLAVPREEFVPPALRESAYDDVPLPIASGQTISQPYVVALTLNALALTGSERVLEIGTGSGYAAAVLSRLAKEVYTVERLAPLAEEAKYRLTKLRYQNVHVHRGDGTLGLPEHAPYEAIAVAAGGPDVPPALLAQLTIGGRLVMPVGRDEANQMLIRVTRVDEKHHQTVELGAVRFVPLIGEQGWPNRDE